LGCFCVKSALLLVHLNIPYRVLTSVNLYFFVKLIKLLCNNVDPDRMVPQLANIPAGMPINFTCLSDSEVTWTHYGPYHNFKDHIVEKNGYIYIPKVKEQDRGIYTCEGYIKLEQHFVPFSSKLVLKVVGMFTLYVFKLKT